MSLTTGNATGNVVWIVSFNVDENGRFLDYAVDTFDIEAHPRANSKLSGLMGKGVFTNYEEAEEWAKKQLAGCNKECCRGCGGCCGNRQ